MKSCFQIKHERDVKIDAGFLRESEISTEERRGITSKNTPNNVSGIFLATDTSTFTQPPSARDGSGDAGTCRAQRRNEAAMAAMLEEDAELCFSSSPMCSDANRWRSLGRIVGYIHRGSATKGSCCNGARMLAGAAESASAIDLQ